MGDGASDLVKLVPEICKRVPDLTLLTAAHPREERMHLFESVASFPVDASKANPIMLQLDDLHWADKPSLLLLQHIARRFKASRLIVVGTYRDVELDRSHPLSAVLGELRRERLHERVLLRGLSESEVQDLIESIYRQEVTGGDGEDFVRAILCETEGNPFFIEEVLRHLAESGAFYRRDGRWDSDAKSIAELGIPEGVRDVIGRRLSRLSETTNRVPPVFFKISRSMGSRWFSRRSSTSSSLSLRLSALRFRVPLRPPPAPHPEAQRGLLDPQLRRYLPMLFPVSWINCTVSALYSAENLRRFRSFSISSLLSRVLSRFSECPSNRGKSRDSRAAV
jgi:hypothetical protein